MTSYSIIIAFNSNACRIILPSADINSSITSSAILVSEFRKENISYVTPSTPKQQTLLSLLLLVCFAQLRQEQRSHLGNFSLYSNKVTSSISPTVYKFLHSLRGMPHQKGTMKEATMNAASS